MIRKFSVSVKIAYKKHGDEPARGRLPSKKGIHDYLKSKKYVTKLAKRIAGPSVTVSSVKLDEQLNLMFTATYKSDKNFMGKPVTTRTVREEMSDSVGIEKCSGSEFPGPCFIPTADGKRILGHVKVTSVRVTAMMSKAKTPMRTSSPKRRSSPKSPSAKPCRVPGKIRNPATGRCVSRDGPTGRKILAGRRS